MRSDRGLQLMSGLVLVTVFIAGTLFGAGVVKRMGSEPAMLPPPHGSPIDAMTHELALDGPQIEALHAIEAAHRPQLEAIRRSAQPRVREVLFAIEDELRPKLRPDQIEKLEAWRAHRSSLPPPLP